MLREWRRRSATVPNSQFDERMLRDIGVARRGRLARINKPVGGAESVVAQGSKRFRARTISWSKPARGDACGREVRWTAWSRRERKAENAELSAEWFKYPDLRKHRRPFPSHAHQPRRVGCERKPTRERAAQSAMGFAALSVLQISASRAGRDPPSAACSDQWIPAFAGRRLG